MPEWKEIVRQRLAGLKLSGAREAEVMEELAQHMHDRYEELLARGVAEPEARRLALEVLSQSELLASELRQRERPLPDPAGPFSGFAFDVRVAWRTLRTKPAFSLMVIGMLAIGIAGNTAIFSIFNGMFLRPLPFAHAERLLDLDETAPKWDLHYVGISEPDACVWRVQNRTFEGIAFFDEDSWNLSGFGPAQRIRGVDVTHEMLNVLELRPFLGRNFTSAEDVPHGPHVVLIGYNLWQRIFHGDRAVLGRVIRLSDVGYTVIGVLPKEAVFPDRTELWLPLGLNPNSENGWYLNAVGRLKPGVSIEQARADLLRVHKAMINTGHPDNAITSPIMSPLRDRYLGDFRTVSDILLTAVGVVLLIACVNIAALMMVRAAARGRELAIRTAMGASRSRIVRQLLTEALLMAALGGVAGVALGFVLLRGMIALMPADDLPQWLSFSMDARFAAFAILITGAAAVLFGLMPTLQASRADSAPGLHESSTRTSLSRGRRRTLNTLVAGEIALALMLLISAGLLAQAFRKVLHVDPGFRPENTITFRLDLPDAKYAKSGQRAAFFRDSLAQLQALPGVQSAGAATALPLGGHWGNFFTAEGAKPLGPHEQNPVVLQVAVSPRYFDAIGMTMLAGRKFDDRDNEVRVDGEGVWIPGTPLVAIVNETFARHYWPGQNAIGRRIRHLGRKAPWITVIGLIHDEKHYGLDQEMRPAVYLPYGEATHDSMSIVLRSAVRPESLVAAAAEVLRRIDPEVPMYSVRTMTARLNESLWARRAYSWLFAAFAAVALLLAAAGIYGVISWAVTQRTQEIGIRMALGARPAQVLQSVLASGMVLVAAGAAAGLVATIFAARLLQTLLFGVSPRDPLIYAAVVAGIGGVGLLANFVPARRAASVDPMQALRTE